MTTARYLERRSELETYFDRTAVAALPAQVVHPPGERDVRVDPAADLLRPVALEGEPHLQAAEPARLLEAVHVVRVALAALVHLAPDTDCVVAVD